MRKLRWAIAGAMLSVNAQAATVLTLEHDVGDLNEVAAAEMTDKPEALLEAGVTTQSMLSGSAMEANAPGPGNAATLIATVWRWGGAAAVPEVATWGTMIGGFGVIGSVLRRRSAAAARRELL